MHNACFTQQFRRNTKRVDQTALRQACEEIIADPFNARGSHRLRHDWAGFRAADFSGPDRIIFRVCKECVQRHEEGQHPLDCCEDEERDEMRITFVDFGDYHSGRRRKLRAKRYSVEE